MSFASDHPAEVFQLFPVLEPATEAALRSSIERHGVLVPVVRDQHGRTLDGYHRTRIAEELGVPYDVTIIDVRDDTHASEIARTLNMDRRHLEPEQRREVVADLRRQGHSLRAIGGALGVSHPTVLADLAATGKDLPVDQPERIVGRDGRSRPATRPIPQPPAYPAQRRTLEAVQDDPSLIPHRDELEADIAAATADTDEELQDAAAQAAIDEMRQHLEETEPEAEHEDDLAAPAGPPVSKPDLGGGISHPARYSSALLPVLQEAVPVDRYGTVLDPFAGTGRIHELENRTVGVELEPEWAALHADTVVGSALDLRFDDGTYDAVVTSPTYGNRLADHHDAADAHLRRSYTHDLGRKLSPDNSGAMQWGPAYREFHEKAWEEAWRVLRPGGRLVLNIKDHIRGGRRQLVTGWHINTLFRLGFELAWSQDVITPNLRQGENCDARLPEQVWVLDKPETRR